jgi:hypothetical protein
MQKAPAHGFPLFGEEILKSVAEIFHQFTVGKQNKNTDTALYECVTKDCTGTWQLQQCVRLSVKPFVDQPSLNHIHHLSIIT